MGLIGKMLGIFKSESTKETENAADGFTPDAQTAYFENGKLYKLYPFDLDNWYDVTYLVSDNKVYDLEKVEDIDKIPIPEFRRMEDDNYGVTGLLDYVLRMKAGAFCNRKERELCSACLWKATEIMFANPLCRWSKKDYSIIIKYHFLLGMDEEAERAKKYLESKGMVFTEYELQEMKPRPKKQKQPSERKKRTPKEKIDWREKELITVRNITTGDMRELDMPFVCNTEVKKYIHDGNHPFAYMEITGENISIVKNEIKKMNTVIKEGIMDYPGIPQNLSIPAGSLVFQSLNYGYTRIMCTPKTFTGKPAKYPYLLYFCTDLSKIGNTTHGKLVYGQDGAVKKATVCFWRNRKGYFLNFKMIDGKLTFTGVGQSNPAW